MICVFDIGNNYFEGNGNAVLTPTRAPVKMVAGGNYDLTMVHPMDPEGKWRHLVPGAVVRAPIPEEEIENAFAGYAADVYKTTEEAALREGPNEPTAINYQQWNWQQAYEVGDKVSVSGWNHRNYECTYYDEGSQTIMAPPYSSSWWKKINDTTGGAAVLVTLPAGTELYFIEDVDATWYKMSTYYGIEGYIKKSQVEFWKHLTPEETKPRIIREQLFRIVNATADTKARTVSVTAQHVSYDLNGIIVKDVVIRQASPAMAIGRMVEGFMIPYAGTIATNLTSEDNGTYTDEIKGKTGMYCFLDPDKGIVGKFGAALKRDNWDLFILQKTETDRGFRIAYRKNMLGVNWARKSDGLVTRVVPVAKDEKGEPLYLPEMWIDSAHINEYPVVRMERLSMKEQVGKDKGLGDDSVWELSDLLDEMRAKAAERFTVDQADRIVDEVTVDFEMLGDTAEYKWLRGLEKVLLYDTVTAVNEEIGLEMPLTVNELEWDAIRQKVVSVKVSNVGNRAGRSVTGYNVQNKSIGWQKLTDDVSDDILNQVRDIIPEYADPEAPRPAIPVMNTKTQDGYVLKGGNNAWKVWKTDDQGNPGWRDEATVSGYIPESEKGAANGVATLDGGGKVPSNQLPSYVDDVLEYANKASFPATGEAGKIYVAKDTGKTYRWSGSAYVELSSYDEATQSASGLMSASDKAKLDGIEAQANKYVLPQATSGALGGIKIGWTGSGKDYPVELDSNGKAHVAVPWTDTTYTLPLAASGTRGGIQIGYSESGKKYAVKLDSEKAYVEVPWTADGGNAATVNGHTVAVDVPSGAKFTDHEYTAGTGLSLSNGQFAVRLAYTTSGKNYKVQADNSGNLYVNVPWTDHYAWSDITDKPATATRWPSWSEVTDKPGSFYSLPLAANGTRGGVQIGYTQSGKNYPVQLSGEKMYVNVPWTDESGNNRVLRAGDTMTGTLSIVGDNSSAIMYVKNTATNIGLSMRSTSDGTHGFISDGYWNGSARVVDAKWMIYRDSTGAIKLNGDADSVDGKHASDFVLKAGDTMTGNLNVEKAGGASVIAKNTTNGCQAYLFASAEAFHGVYSNGYYNGSSFVSGTKWLIYRDDTGKVVANGDCAGNAASATKLASTGTIRQYWRGDNSWSTEFGGNLYFGSAYPNGQNNKPYHEVATFNQSVNGTQINTQLTCYVSSFYSPMSKGILEVSCRWEASATSPSWLYCRWLVGDDRIDITKFIATWKYNSSTKIVTLKLYVNVIGWASHNFVRISEENWGSSTTDWIMNKVIGNTGIASIPSDETPIVSVYDKLINSVEWSKIANKPSNYPGGCTGSADSVNGKHASDFVQKIGDTMSGTLHIKEAADNTVSRVAIENKSTGSLICDLEVSTGGNHGVYSNGYWNGSAFVSSGKWLIKRGQDGVVTVDGNCTGNANTASGFVGNVYKYYYVTVMPQATGWAAGWRRVCKVVGASYYGNFMLAFTGAYNTAKPCNVLVSVNLSHQQATLTQVSGVGDGYMKAIRLVNVSGGTYWLDVYFDGAGQSSYTNNAQIVEIYGNVTVTDQQNSSAVYTGTVTPTAFLRLRLGTTFTRDVCITNQDETGDSPSLMFLRGTETDNYTDLRLFDSAGSLVLQKRDNTTSNVWTNVATINTSGTYSGNCAGSAGSVAWSGVTSRPIKYFGGSGTNSVTIEFPGSGHAIIAIASGIGTIFISGAGSIYSTLPSGFSAICASGTYKVTITRSNSTTFYFHGLYLAGTTELPIT